jgi:hypothetical protein
MLTFFTMTKIVGLLRLLMKKSKNCTKNSMQLRQNFGKRKAFCKWTSSKRENVYSEEWGTALPLMLLNSKGGSLAN